MTFFLDILPFFRNPGRHVTPLKGTIYWFLAKTTLFSELAPKKCSKKVWTNTNRKKRFCWSPVYIKCDVISFSSLRLLLKVWIWYRCQNRIEKYYHYDIEQLGFYKKYQNTQKLSKKKDVLVIAVSQETKNSNLFDKTRTQDNVKCHARFLL